MSSQAVAWAIVHQAGGMSAKAALLSLANYANEYGECWASQQTIADGAECSVRQVRRILSDLEARGLIERERRGGAGKGRDTDMIRLRMCELPAILTSKRREEEQPDKLAGSQATGHHVRGASGHPVRGATGQMRGGNRTTVSDNPNIPTLSNERDSPARRLLASMRKHMSPAGNQRSKPVPCEKALTPLIKRHGFEAVLTAAQAFYASQQAQKERGEFQPGLQVIANDGRLEVLIETGGADDTEQKRRLWVFETYGEWRPDWGPRPDSKAQGGSL